MKIWLLFPAYNEAPRIGNVLLKSSEKLTNYPYEIVVVNDGSRDDTSEAVKKTGLPVTLLVHPHNKGLGAALNTGYSYILERAQPDDIVVSSESDGTQDPAKLIELVQAIMQGADMVVANPLANGGFVGVPRYRQYLSRGGNLIYSLLFPIPGLHDYTNLLRAQKASLLLKAHAKYKDKLIERIGFEAVPELILKLRQFNPKPQEIPITIDFRLKNQASTMSITKTILNSLGLCLERLVRS